MVSLVDNRRVHNPHGRAQLAAVRQQGRQLRVDEVAHILEMVRLIRLEQQQSRWPVRQVAELWEKERIACSDDAVGEQETSVAMVGMQPVALPRVMTEHHVGPYLADPGGNLEALAEAGLELAVGPAEKDHLALATERHRCRALLVAPSDDELGRVLREVPCSLGSVGADEVEDLAAVGRPFGERPSTS